MDRESKARAIMADLEKRFEGTHPGQSVDVMPSVAVTAGYIRDMFEDDDTDYECIYLKIRGMSVAELWVKSNDWEIDLFYTLLSLGVQSPAPDEIIKWGQDAATFGVTPAIYYELLTKIGNVSFQPPAPDENGLLIEIQALCHEAYNEAGSNWQHSNFQSRFMVWWERNFERIRLNTRAHAPIAGKDPITESMRQEYNEVLSIARKRQEAIDELRSKSAKLIEALEEISNELRTSADVPKMLDFIKVMADKALAAYKGKEGGA